MNSNWTMLAVVCVVVIGLAISLGRPSRQAPPDSPAEGTDAASSVADQKLSGAGSIVHADEADFQQLVLDSETPVLVDFYFLDRTLVIPKLGDLGQSDIHNYLRRHDRLLRRHDNR